MAQNFIQKGEILEYLVPASTTINSGAPVVIGSRVGVALGKGSTGETIRVQMEGVFRLPKKAATAINQGVAVAWDVTPGDITPTLADGTACGYAFEAALSADTHILVKLAG
jgi:predicted RecA/RadA family phage recombinase